MQNSSFELTNKYPHLYLRSKESSFKLYDSAETAARSQIDTKNFRGEAYLKSAIVKSYNGLNLYTIVIEAQTIEWLSSSLMERDRKYIFEFGWTDDVQKKEIAVIDVVVNLVLEYGGAEITLTAKDYDNPFHPDINCNNVIWNSGLGSIKTNPTMQQVFSVMKNIFSHLDTVSFKGETFEFNQPEFERLRNSGEKSIMHVLNSILAENHRRLIFHGKECRIEKLIGLDREKAVSKEYTWGSDSSEIERMEINFVVPDSKEKSKRIQLDKNGKEQTTTEEDDAPKSSQQLETSALESGEEPVNYEKRYLPPVWAGSMNVLGDNDIFLFDRIEVNNVGILSSVYTVTEVTHKVAHDGFYTELVIVTETEEGF